MQAEMRRPTTVATPLSSSTAPAIILPPRSRSPKTSPLCVCHPTLLSSIQSKTSGNICAATNSRSPSSTTTTTSSIKRATHGTSLNKIQSASRQSPHEHGQQSIIRAVGITHRPGLIAGTDWLFLGIRRRLRARSGRGDRPRMSRIWPPSPPFSK